MPQACQPSGDWTCVQQQVQTWSPKLFAVHEASRRQFPSSPPDATIAISSASQPIST